MYTEHVAYKICAQNSFYTTKTTYATIIITTLVAIAPITTIVATITTTYATTIAIRTITIASTTASVATIPTTILATITSTI